MLHVLFVILKIIGILLAVILGLLLLILLLVLFVPIRYKGRLCREKELELAAGLSWLLHSISVPITYQDGTLSVKIKLFGITIKKLMEDEEELEHDMDELFGDVEDAVSEGEKRVEEIEEPGSSKQDAASMETSVTSVVESQGKRDAAQEDLKEDTTQAEKAADDWQEEEESSESEIADEPTQANIIKRIAAKIKAFFLKIFGIWKKIKNLKYTFHRFCGKIKKGIRKYRDTKEFLTDERTRGAIRQCVNQGKLLIRKLFPKKIRGELRFGTEDPALTGEILGGISIFYPIFMDNVKVYPDFEQPILEGELFVKGRFRLATAALILWRLWRDKNIRYVYHKLR